jgi:hypothetical protein
MFLLELEGVSMHIFIPTWVLWIVGIPLAVVIIFFAVIGFMFWWSIKDGIM